MNDNTRQPRGARPHLWIVEHYGALPSKDGRAGRHLGLAEALVARGWDVTLFVASTSHPDGRQRMGSRRLRKVVREHSVDAVILRSLSYGRSTLRRFAGMLTFTAQVLAPSSTAGVRPPDVVIGSTVHPFAAWAGGHLARRHRVKFVYEVRDVWPETLIDLGKLSHGSPVARLMRVLARRTAQQADLVISPLRQLDRYLDDIGKGDTPFVWVSNGVNVLPDSTSSHQVCAGRPFTFMYLGSHGNANVLDYIMRSFSRACDLDPALDAKLVFVGDGPLKPEYVRYAATLDVSDRISFEPQIPRSEVTGRAQEADSLVMALPRKNVFRFGISPNKLFDYMLAAKPVVLSVDQPNPIADAAAGVVVPADDVEAFAQAMVDMTRTTQAERALMGGNGRRHVEENYDYSLLAARLDTALTRLLGPGSGDHRASPVVGGQRDD